jgi:DNA-binding protein HU-beta
MRCWPFFKASTRSLNPERPNRFRNPVRFANANSRRNSILFSCVDLIFWLFVQDMAKALTKSQIIVNIAETVGITKKQAAQALECLAELAYKNAKHSFTLPGLGKLVLVSRPARTMTMAFGPKKGQTIKIPARKVVKFRVAKAAKEAILGSK